MLENWRMPYDRMRPPEMGRMSVVALPNKEGVIFMLLLQALLVSVMFLTTPTPAAADDGGVQFDYLCVWARATVVDAPQFGAVDVWIMRRRFNQIREDAGIGPACDHIGLRLQVVAGAGDASVGLPPFVALDLEVMDDDFDGPREKFGPENLVLFGTDGICP